MLEPYNWATRLSQASRRESLVLLLLIDWRLTGSNAEFRIRG